MFKLIYAGSVLKDLRKVSPDQLPKIKNSFAELENFPNISQVKKRFRIF
jgi:mRNA interferase RelE/StbE